MRMCSIFLLRFSWYWQLFSFNSMQSLFILTLQVLAIPLLSPLCVGFTRVIKARLQNRRGASPLQPYRDLWKLFHKDEVVSADASWVFRQAPFIIFATTLVVSASIPFITTAVHNGITGDFLLVVYALAFGTFFLALAGMDTGGGFGGFGASREMMVASLAEGGFIVSLLTLAVLAKTGNLFEIPAAIMALGAHDSISVVLAFIGFIIIFLAETSRYPFDNPATHLELTMIHEAMILEYSGKRLALIEWAAANKYLIFMAMAVNLFFPWGLATTLSAGELVVAFGVFCVKVAVLCVSVGILESSIAKLRIFKLPGLLFTSCVISIIALGLAL